MGTKLAKYLKESTFDEQKKINNKKRVRNHIRTEIRAGRIKPKPCEICGDTPTESHHDDYRKPYKIRWLCKKHHAEVEAKSRK